MNVIACALLLTAASVPPGRGARASAPCGDGMHVAPATLAAYAGVYEIAAHEIHVSVSGNDLIVDDTETPVDRRFVARSDTAFSSCAGRISIEFVRDASGRVTHFVRRIGAREERAYRK